MRLLEVYGAMVTVNISILVYRLKHIYSFLLEYTAFSGIISELLSNLILMALEIGETTNYIS